MEGNSPTTRSRAVIHGVRNAVGEGHLMFRRFLITLIVLILLAGAGWQILRNQAGPIIRNIVQNQLEDHFREHGIFFRLGSVEFYEGRELCLRDIALSNNSKADKPFLEAAEVHVYTSATLWDLIRKDLKLRSVEVRRLKADIEENSEGKWNFEKLLAHLPKQQTGANKPLPVLLKDTSIVVTKQIGDSAWTERINDLEVHVIPQKQLAVPSDPKSVVYSVQGKLVSSHVGNLNIHGEIVPSLEAFQIQGRLDQFRLGTDMVTATAQVLNKPELQQTKIDATLSTDFALTGYFRKPESWTYHLRGSVQDGRVDDPRIPYPLTSVRANFEITHKLISVKDLYGKTGLGEITGEVSQIGDASNRELLATIRAVNVSLDRRLADCLPPSVQTTWQEIQPSGIMDATLEVRGWGKTWKPQLKLGLRDVTMTHFMFPYPVINCIGDIEWSPKKLLVKARGLASGSMVTVNIDYDNPGKNFTGVATVELANPIAVDEEFFRALHRLPNVEKIVRKLNPSGKVQLQLRRTRNSVEEKPSEWISVALSEGTVRYQDFNYPITNIEGTVEYHNGEVFLKEVSGRNDTGIIVCNGSWTRDKKLNLKFLALEVPLEDELKLALNPSLQQLWSDLRPKGTLDKLEVDVLYDDKTKLTDIAVQGTSWEHEANDPTMTSINPIWFPYELHQVSGRFGYANGNLTLTGIRGQRGDTVLSVDGTGKIDADSWEVSCTPLRIERLPIDNAALDALPTQLRQALRAISLEGLLNIAGTLTVRGSTQSVDKDRFVPQLAGSSANLATNTLASGTLIPNPSYPRHLEIDWDMRVDVAEGHIFAGQAFNQIHGAMQTMGRMIDETFDMRIELAIDSAMCRGTQITNITGPIEINERQVRAGTWIKAFADEGLAPRPVTGRVVGGTIKVDTEVQMVEGLPYEVQLSVENGSIEDFCADFAPSLTQVAGEMYVGARCSGKGTDPNSLQGSGSIRLREANIYEFPVMIAMLKILSVKQVDRTAFTSGNIDFRLIGDRILLDRVDFLGDAISMKGSGECDWEQRIQAEFWTQVGSDENRVPIVSNIFGAASRQMLCVNVTGTLNDPQVMRIAFPTLNQTLQTLVGPETEPDPILPGIPSASQILSSPQMR